jgi:hypothetical protein
VPPVRHSLAAILWQRCSRCGQPLQTVLPDSEALLAEIQDALAILQNGVASGALAHRNGFYHQGVALALEALASFLLAGWTETPSADDKAVLALLRDAATNHNEAARGKHPSQHKPVALGRGRRSMPDVQICYRAWAAQASLAQSNASPLPLRRTITAANLKVSIATHWVDESPDARERLGGTLSLTTVRNMRQEVEKNSNHPVAMFARGIPPIVAAKGTPEAAKEAAWFLAQLSTRTGHAFARL